MVPHKPKPQVHHLPWRNEMVNRLLFLVAVDISPIAFSQHLICRNSANCPCRDIHNILMLPPLSTVLLYSCDNHVRVVSRFCPYMSFVDEWCLPTEDIQAKSKSRKFGIEPIDFNKYRSRSDRFRNRSDRIQTSDRFQRTQATEFRQVTDFNGLKRQISKARWQIWFSTYGQMSNQELEQL
jgi:hypothetical protein